MEKKRIFTIEEIQIFFKNMKADKTSGEIKGKWYTDGDDNFQFTNEQLLAAETNPKYDGLTFILEDHRKKGQPWAYEEKTGTLDLNKYTCAGGAKSMISKYQTAQAAADAKQSMDNVGGLTELKSFMTEFDEMF